MLFNYQQTLQESNNAQNTQTTLITQNTRIRKDRNVIFPRRDKGGIHLSLYQAC